MCWNILPSKGLKLNLFKGKGWLCYYPFKGSYKLLLQAPPYSLLDGCDRSLSRPKLTILTDFYERTFLTHTHLHSTFLNNLSCRSFSYVLVWGVCTCQSIEVIEDISIECDNTPGYTYPITILCGFLRKGIWSALPGCAILLIIARRIATKRRQWEDNSTVHCVRNSSDNVHTEDGSRIDGSIYRINKWYVVFLSLLVLKIKLCSFDRSSVPWNQQLVQYNSIILIYGDTQQLIVQP